MKRRNFLEKLAVGSIGLAGLNFLNEGSVWATESDKKINQIRLREQLDFDWRFQLGDISGAQASSFSDSNWRLLDLPHDWSIEGQFDKENPASWHGAYLPGGIGWYRKELIWNSSWKGRNVLIDFDGIFMNSDVWINGNHLGNWPYGFSSFRYDLTPYLKNGANVIAVRVDNSKLPSARWYTGSGIYRHVWLNVVSPVYVAHWGTFVSTPRITKDSADVHIMTRITNTTGIEISLEVEQTIRDRQGRVVARSGKPVTIKVGSESEDNQDLSVPSPDLWSPDSPNLYEVETLIKEGGKVLDQYFTPLGIRKLEFSAEWGFRLNGEQTMIKGVCNHHDGGGAVGAAVPDDVLFHRLKQLKEIGCNAVRTAHNPHSPELYAYCDALGLMVLDEAFDGWNVPKGNSKFDYGLYFNEWWEKDLGNMVRRDRNHPSVIMWSIGNEVNSYTDEWQTKLANLVRKLDPTRPITEARGVNGPAIDIAGFNSEAEKIGTFENYHKQFPNRPLLGTEMPHTRQTRGVYLTQSKHPDAGSEGNKHAVPNLSAEEVFPEVSKYYSSSYDNDFMSANVRDQYKQNKRLPYLIGSFRWTGHDYLGEANNQWPMRSKDKGIFDLAGIAKDHYFLYQSLWTKLPMVHLLPHWTHPGKEGKKIPVVAYSNCKKVELFFNDKSLGEQIMGEDLQLVWQVPYQPGKLTAVAKDENGTLLAKTSQQTAGIPSEINIVSNKTTVKANRRDVINLEITVVDKQGIPVPDDDHLVYFDIEGPGKLIGVDNGDVADLNPTKNTNQRKVFKGKCVGLVQATNQKGNIKITVHSEGLKSSVALIPSV